MSFGAGRFEGLETVASEEISPSNASQVLLSSMAAPVPAKKYLSQLQAVLPDTWLQHLHTHYQQYQHRI